MVRILKQKLIADPSEVCWQSISFEVAKKCTNLLDCIFLRKVWGTTVPAGILFHTGRLGF